MTLNEARVLGIRYVRLPRWKNDVYYDHQNELLYRPRCEKMQIGCESYLGDCEFNSWEKASEHQRDS